MHYKLFILVINVQKYVYYCLIQWSYKNVIAVLVHQVADDVVKELKLDTNTTFLAQGNPHLDVAQLYFINMHVDNERTSRCLYYSKTSLS
jgi:hypothetical protein